MQVNLEFVYDLTPQMIDEMIDAMRAGTYAVPPMTQTEKPPQTWIVKQDGQVSQGTKSAGALDQPDPNNAGGLDKDGVIMLDRIISREAHFKGRTKERLATEQPVVINIVGNGATH
jgi:hypothetical protein